MRIPMDFQMAIANASVAPTDESRWRWDFVCRGTGRSSIGDRMER